MLDKDIYVSHTPYRDLSMQETVRKISRTLGASAGNVKDLLTLLGAYTIHISHEELRRLLPENNSAYLNHVVKEGIGQLVMDGVLLKKNLQRTLGMSKCVFMFQKKGEPWAKEIRGGRLTVKYPARFTKDKVKEDKVRAHTYCTGMNLFQMLFLEIPLEWERERTYPEGFQKGTYRDLQIDGTCRLYPGDQNKGRVLYFEQDMSTENYPELLEKLFFYEQYHLMDDPDSLIVFSFYDAKKGFISQNHTLVTPYSVKRAKALYAFMAENNCKDVDHALKVGFEDGEYVRVLKDMVKRADQYGVDETARAYVKETPVTKEFVEHFLKTLTKKVNPYEERELNTIHVELTKKKITGLATRVMEKTYHNIRYMEPIRRGMQVLGLPTTLVSNRIPYAMLSWSKEKQEELISALLPYFGKLNFVSERTKLLEIAYGRDVTTKISLRNVFSYMLPVQGLVCVEMPFMDIGAWVRVKMLVEGYREKTPVSVVCVFEDSEQAKSFFGAIPHEHDHMGIPLDVHGVCGIYGTYLRDLSTVIIPIGEGEIARLPGNMVSG